MSLQPFHFIFSWISLRFAYYNARYTYIRTHIYRCVSTRLPLELWLITVQWSIIDKKQHIIHSSSVHPFHVIVHIITLRVVIVYCIHFISLIRKLKVNAIISTQSSQMNGAYLYVYMCVHIAANMSLWKKVYHTDECTKCVNTLTSYLHHIETTQTDHSYLSVRRFQWHA